MKIKQQGSELEQLALSKRLQTLGFQVKEDGTVTAPEGVKAPAEIGQSEAAKLWSEFSKAKSKSADAEATEAVQSLSMTIMGFGKSLETTVERLRFSAKFDKEEFSRITRRAKDLTEKLEQLVGGSHILSAADPKAIGTLLHTLNRVNYDAVQFAVATSEIRSAYVASGKRSDIADEIVQSLEAGVDVNISLQELMNRLTAEPGTPDKAG